VLTIDLRLQCSRFLAALIALTGLSAFPSYAQAELASRPIRILVGFLPGSSNDLLARFIGAKLSERLRQQVVVENRPGANGIIASEHTSRATPDGHTLMLMSISHTMAAAVYGKLPYDPVKSFTPVATIGAGPLVVAAHASLPGGVKGVIEMAKAKPKTLNYASAGTGGINHFAAALFSRVAGVQMTHVPYKGGAPALADVIAGHVQLMWGSMPLTLPHLRAERIKALAVTSTTRSPILPEVATIAESGAPGAEISAWWGILAPSGVPSALLRRLNAEIGSILREPESARKLSAEGAEPWIMSSAEFTRVIGSEIEKWSRVAREAQIRVD
jgi:tripartite-type tricarboxylate transporter receptor subunit TctC